MKALDAGQAALLRSAAVEVVECVVLTTYTDRTALTVSQVFYFASSSFLYDYGNTGTVRQFEPFLVAIEREREEMNHLPTNAQSLRRDRTITLRNGDRNGEKLWKTLRAENIELARVETAMVAIDPSSDPDIQLRMWDQRAMAGDEHTVTYRGRIVRVPRVDTEIELECETDFPVLPILLATDATKIDPRDLGKRLPVVYGAAKRVPAIGWEVGAVTTVAQHINDTQDQLIELTDATNFEASGSRLIFINGEQIQYTGRTGNTIDAGITRGFNNTTPIAHAIGSFVIELPSGGIVYVLAGHESKALDELFARSPFTGQLVRIVETTFTVNLADTTLIAGETVTSVTFTPDEVQLLLGELALTGQGVNGGVVNQTAVSISTSDQTASDGNNTSVRLVDEGDGFNFTPIPGTFDRQRIRITMGGTNIGLQPTIDGNGIPPLQAGNDNDVLEWETTAESGHLMAIVMDGSNESIRDIQRDYFTSSLIAVTEQDPVSCTGATCDLAMDDNTGTSTNQNFLGTFTFPSVAGEFVAQVIEVWRADTFGMLIRDTDSLGAIMFQIPDGFGTAGWYEYWSTVETDVYWIDIQSTGRLYEIKRRVYTRGGAFDQTVEMVGGQAIEVYADLQGFDVEAGDGANYEVATSTGDLIEAPTDIVTHFIAKFAGLGFGALDGAAAANTNLSGNIHSGNFVNLGFDFEEFVLVLAREFRLNIFPVEGASETTYRMIAAESDYEWPAPVRTVTRYTEVREETRGRDLYKTRFRYMYNPDAAEGELGNSEIYQALVQIDVNQNDVTNPSTVELQAAEDRLGRLDQEQVLLPMTTDLATAEDIAGYYAHELIRVAGIHELRDVPLIESVDLEQGDIIDYTSPNTGDVVKGRIIAIDTNAATKARTIRIVEVP